MKKGLLFCVSLLFCFSGNIEVFGEQQNILEENNLSIEVNQKKITKEFIGRGNTEKERDRQQRSLRYSSLETSGLYAEAGNTLTVEVSGQDSLELIVGTPERDTQKKYSLDQGTNTIKVENKGVIYITNPNDTGSAVVTISGSTGYMPYFDLNTTSIEDFQKQMSAGINATDVQLVSNKAIITVSYEQAKKNIKDPKELMDYYDKFLEAQDRVSGINNNGKPENFVDRHFQHFIEIPRLYMFSTHEYMGFNGDAALARLLKTDNGWGIWHESGHQRQQAPWKWKSVGESTVNIYSMASQKEITGSITALDEYYPQMHTFLQSENKDFEKQNNDLKMVLFGQLANTFGENFYPILHQYYRENILPYDTDIERIQNFIVSVSNITGYNMIPYFEQWGFTITDTSRKKTSTFLDLPKDIWLNDGQILEKLPMRLINKVTLSEKEANFELTTFENDIFQGQKLVLIKNGQYVSELANKKPYYSSLEGNIWKTKITLKPTDKVRIEARNSDGTFQLYNSSITGQKLKDEIFNYLNSEDNLSEIITQGMLDNIRNEIAEIVDEEEQQTLFKLLERLEIRYLTSLVKDISRDMNGKLYVEFSNAKFKEYNKIVILGTDSYIAEVVNGKPYYSTLSGNLLTVSQQGNQEKFSVQFRLPHKTYTVSEINKEELLLKRDVEDLFTENNQLKEDVTQEILDELRSRISLLSGDLKERLTIRVSDAQQLFFELMISEMEFDDSKLVVRFSNDLYKNYKIVVLEDKKYMAEVSNGKPYYGQLNGATFTTTKNVNVGSLYEVEIRHSSGNYKIKEKIFS